MSVNSTSNIISFTGNGTIIDLSASNSSSISRVIDVQKLREDIDRVFIEFAKVSDQYRTILKLYDELKELYSDNLSSEVISARDNFTSSFKKARDDMHSMHKERLDEKEVYALVMLTSSSLSPDSSLYQEVVEKACQAQERVDSCESWNIKWGKILSQHEQYVQQRLQERKEELKRLQAQQRNQTEDLQNQNHEPTIPESTADNTANQGNKAFSFITGHAQQLVKKIDQLKQTIGNRFSSQTEKKDEHSTAPNIPKTRSWCHLSKEDLFNQKSLFFLVVLLMCCILAQRLFLILFHKPIQAST